MKKNQKIHIICETVIVIRCETVRLRITDQLQMEVKLNKTLLSIWKIYLESIKR